MYVCVYVYKYVCMSVMSFSPKGTYTFQGLIESVLRSKRTLPSAPLTQNTLSWPETHSSTRIIKKNIKKKMENSLYLHDKP